MKKEEPYKGIVLFGPPGVGKGVQADVLAKDRGLVHLSTGDVIREEIKAGTELGKRVLEKDIDSLAALGISREQMESLHEIFDTNIAEAAAIKHD